MFEIIEPGVTAAVIIECLINLYNSCDKGALYKNIYIIISVKFYVSTIHPIVTS